MRISLSWIERLLGRPLPVTPAELQARLSLTVAEIEGELERTGPALDGVVVGRVLECRQHPNADRLRCCSVDIGAAAPVPIVCGAPNVAAGQTVAVATVGCTLTAADGKPLTIKPAKLRGEPSQGMICAEDELGLGTSHDGILVLDPALVPGTPLGSALGLGDLALVVENHALTHRPDLWGHLGWAREISAVLALPTPALPDPAWSDLDPGGWSATIQDDGCTTWCGAVVEGVANRESPAWMRRALQAAGVRPLGLLVDITNWVMLELGEPMHAFDLREVRANRIVVRGAAANEPFATLDGKAHRLAAGDLLICDGERALALAGIMGGQASMVRDDTAAVLLEAAVFRSDRIRRTRMRTGIATDSSARFEKGQRPEAAAAAIARACALLAELCPGCRVVRRFHAGATAEPARTIPFDPRRTARLTGLEVPEAEQLRILAALGIPVAGGTATVPWWRTKDMHGPADLVEEVARHHGYQRIVPEVPRLPAAAPAIDPLRRAEHLSRRVLSAHGWDEVQTYAFTSAEWAHELGWDAEGKAITLAHPLSSEQTVLRRSLLPTLLEAVGRNRKNLDRVAIYEVARRYGAGLGRGDTPDEETVAAGACAAAGDETPVYAARDAALALLAGLGYAEARAEACPEAAGRELSPGRTLRLVVGRQVVGVAGEVPAALRRRAGCPERTGWFCIQLEQLVQRCGVPRPVLHRAPSRFQAVEREFTFDCAETATWQELAGAAGAAAGALGQGVRLVTVYRGQPYPAGRKAVSLAVLLQSDERTLDERDLTGVSTRIAQAVGAATGATLVGR
jgi:phenylalanyl-tRNA synthetase beta chain